MHIESIETPELGDRTYLVHDGDRAVVIDPQRDFDRVLEVADRAGVTIDMVLETHIHNDYVSGGLALSRQVGAGYGVAAAEPVAFDRFHVAPGDVNSVGKLTVRVEAAPGHTMHHLAFVVEAAGHPQAVFTGGSLLFGTVGRTDLDHRGSPDSLTRAQYRSVRGLLERLPAAVTIHPTHGFGSFCSSSASSGATSSTIGIEQRDNLVARSDEDGFVETVLAGLTTYPRYYAQMGPANRRGAAAADLDELRPIDRVDLRDQIRSGEWVVDLESRRLYATRHLRGTLNIELGTDFTTYLGWVIPTGVPVTLVGSADELRAARRALARIGVDEPIAALRETADTEMTRASAHSYPRMDFAAAAAEIEDRSGTVLDVRRDDEWRGGHIRGAVHVPLPELLERLGEVPPRQLWVHCASGFRASIAASLLSRSGFDVVLIDDDFEQAAPAGLVIDRPAATADNARHSASAHANKGNGDGKP
ncbi:MAG: MBL fold metallo-hydrolase [Candidatus Dormibacter sp.]